MASSLCARVSNDGRADRLAYSIDVRPNRRRTVASAASGRSVGVRYLRGAAEDRLVHPGGTLLLAPGRPSATLIRRALQGGGPEAFLEAVETALMHAAALHGAAFLHAGVFEVRGSGVVAIGASLSGKSTLVGAELHAGARIVSDDAALVWRTGAGALRVTTTCRDLRLRGASARVVPASLRGLMDRAESAGRRRWRLRRDAAPRRFALGCPVSVVLRVRVDRRRRRPAVRRLGFAELLASLINASSPLMVSARYAAERAALMPLLVSIAETVPGYEVRMGTDLLTDPETTVRRLLADVGVHA